MNRNLKSLLNGNSQALRNGDHDDSSDADLNQVAGNRGCRSDPVAIDKALGDIVADHRDDTGNSDSQRIPAVAVKLLGAQRYQPDSRSKRPIPKAPARVPVRRPKIMAARNSGTFPR